MDELLKSVRQQIDERLSSPLLGTFVISWCLWNYKFLVILFSAAQVTQTFKLIEAIAFPDIASILLRGVLYPLFTSAIYIFAYPYPARLVYRFVHRARKALEDERRVIEGQSLLTLDESRRIRTAREQLEMEHNNEVDRKNKEIDRLREVLKSRSVGEPESTELRPEPPAAKAEPPEPAPTFQLAQPLTSQSLAAYTKWKYPDLSVSEYLNDKTIRDLNRINYATLRQIDDAVNIATPAVNAYQVENPDWFKYGTDFITKSLGFVDPEFRAKHNFAEKTLEAFRKYKYLRNDVGDA